MPKSRSKKFLSKISIKARKKSAHKCRKDLKKFAERLVQRAENSYRPYNKYQVRVGFRKEKMRIKIDFMKKTDAHHCLSNIQNDDTFLYFRCKMKISKPKKRHPKKTIQKAPLQYLPFLEVKILSLKGTQLQTKKCAKEKLIQIVKEAELTYHGGKYSWFRVQIKRNRKLVAHVKFTRSSEAEHCFNNIRHNQDIITWECQFLQECFQRCRPIFKQNFKRLAKKRMVFKDRDNHSAAGLAYLPEIKADNQLKRKIMGAIRTQNPAVREKVRRSRQKRKIR